MKLNDKIFLDFLDKGHIKTFEIPVVLRYLYNF